MSTEEIPYIKWGDYKSQEEENPDILEFKVSDLDKFDSEYSVNVQILLKVENKFEYRNLPLKSHNSRNASLLKQWNEGVKTKKIKKGKKIQLETWLDKSKYNFGIRNSFLDF